MSPLIFVIAYAVATARGDNCPSGSEYYSCTACNSSTAPAECIACVDDAILDNKKCFTSCNYTGPVENSNFIPHCLACWNSYPLECMTCEEGYYTSDDWLSCIPAVECSEDITTPNCNGCDDSGWCASCVPPYYLYDETDLCHIQCDKFSQIPEEYRLGCIECASDGSCAKCDGFVFSWNEAYGGTCIYDTCRYKDDNGVVTMCKNHGKCDISQEYPTCECDSDTRDRLWGCACKQGYSEDKYGNCVASKCPDMPAYQHCIGCYASNGALVCTGCKEGYTNSEALCNNIPIEGCKYETAMGLAVYCFSCEKGYSITEFCEKNHNHEDTTKPHCTTMANGKCTSCDHYFTDVDNDCNTPCASKLCQRCDPKDPTICTQCNAGLPPKCLAVCSASCSSGKLCTIEGACVDSMCVGIDPTYYNGFYGTLPAYVTCSGKGQCESGSDGKSACKCNEGHDPSTRCFSCTTGNFKNAEGNCVPRAGSPCPENCETCDAGGKCVGCMPGFSDPHNNCDKKCTDPMCARCSPNNPDICTMCISGSGSGTNLINPPCFRQCNEDCSKRTDGNRYCLIWANGTGASCGPDTCAKRESGGRYTECYQAGTCTNGKCVCNHPKGNPNEKCGDCLDDYEFDSEAHTCYEALHQDCSPVCLDFEECTMVDGAPTCISMWCTYHGKSCNDQGSCQRAGYCKCNDPGLDFRSYCADCKPGYVRDASNKCIYNDCMNGPAKVKNCIECLIPGVTMCSKCKGGAMPSSDNACVSQGASLGGGVIAAIVICVIVVLALTAFLVYWFLFRKPKAGAVKMGGNTGNNLDNASSNSL